MHANNGNIDRCDIIMYESVALATVYCKYIYTSQLWQVIANLYDNISGYR